MVELWSWARTAERLARLRAYAEHLAARMGKTVVVRVEHHDMRIPRDYLEKFWTTLVLSTMEVDRDLLIEVRDDGTGVDREALLRCARAAGKDLPDDSAIEALLFLDGVSSRAEVSETSGRGVGLSAVKSACEADGTSFRFRFRQPVVKTGALAQRLERRWSLRPTFSVPAASNTNVRDASRANPRVKG